MDRDYLFYARQNLHEADGKLQDAQKNIIKSGVPEMWNAPLKRLINSLRRIDNDLLWLAGHLEEEK